MKVTLLQALARDVNEKVFFSRAQVWGSGFAPFASGGPALRSGRQSLGTPVVRVVPGGNGRRSE